MHHLDLMMAKCSRAESVLCAISGTKIGKESVLSSLMPKQSVVLSVGSINVNQTVVENTSVEDKNGSSTYKIHDCTNEKVSPCEQVQSNAPSSMIDDTDEGSKDSEASSPEQSKLMFRVYDRLY